MNLDIELQALTQNLLADTSIQFITQLQIGGLNGLLSMGLQDKSPETRHAVLRVLAGDAMFKIAGVEVNSAKNLTGPVATFLINILKQLDSSPWRLSRYGTELIAAVESRVKEYSMDT
jgi:hypothetical protein